MWGREMRAGLAFVLVSLLVGTLARDWQRDHRARFEDLVADLERGDQEDRGRPGITDTTSGGAAGGAQGTVADPSAAGAMSPARAHPRAEPPLRPGGIDVERASAAEWERLPGIGPSLAARIVADRAAHGPFGTLEGLLRVRGIGAKTLERIRPYLAPTPADSGSPIAN